MGLTMKPKLKVNLAPFCPCLLSAGLQTRALFLHYIGFSEKVGG